MTDQPRLDETALAELQEVMDDDFELLVETFLADARARLARLQRLLEREELDELTKAAHSFKGSCLNMGAMRLSELCAQLERAGKSADLAAAGTLLNDVQAEFTEVSACFERL